MGMARWPRMRLTGRRALLAGLGCGRGVEGFGVGARLQRDTAVLPLLIRLPLRSPPLCPLGSALSAGNALLSQKLSQSQGARETKEGGETTEGGIKEEGGRG